MIALIMAGGKGSRMNNSEKLLLKYKKPIISHVIEALIHSNCFDRIIVVTSPNAPKTKHFLSKLKVEIVETSGNGYVQDLNYALNQLSDDVLVVSGDLPLLDEIIIKKIVSEKNSNCDWISFIVTKEFLNSLGLSGEFEIKYKEKQCMYTGVSLVNARKINSLETIDEHYKIVNDKKIAFNLNTQKEYDLLSVT